MVAQLSANMFAGSLPTGPAPTEAELRAQYDAAKAASAKRRAEGFLGQVVLPGEGDFESFRALQLTPYGGLGVATGPTDTGLGGPPLGGQPPPPFLSNTPGSASGIEIKGDPNFITPQPRPDPDKDDFYAFKSTLRDPGDMGRYIAPGEEMSYEDFVKFGRPANLVAAESAGYGGGALLSDAFGNKVSLGSLEGTAEAGGILGGTAAAGGILSEVFGPAIAGGGLVPGSGVVGGILPHTPDGPIDPYARPQPGMFPQPVETNPDAINNPTNVPLPSNKKLVDGNIVDNGNPLVAPDMTQRPMPFSGLASLTKLPMFQEFATKLESEHPEASQLFSQMFMGSSQRPMPFQNPFMGMGMGSFHPMMGGMGMGGYNPMMGMGGGFNPMMGGMGMGGYSPFMGMNPMMGMGGGFNPMMGMSGGGLGSFYPQPSTYGPPQSMPSMGGYPTPPQSSPFGGAMRGYYA